MIQLRSVHKRFGSTVAVEDVSFTAANGVVTGVLGPNGAGKTTMLRMIGGLIKPDSGVVAVDGLDVAASADASRRLVGILPEEVGLYDRLTVREHLEYALALQGMAGSRGALDGLMDRLGLLALCDRRGGALSFGERRRVALARALVHDPPNVVLDEPTNALDVLTVRQVRSEIRRLAARDVAVVVSSHVMPEIMATCDRLVVLSRGRVIAATTPAALLAETGDGSLEDAFVRLVAEASETSAAPSRA
jgi:sodium transport system ATP-binding protein